MEPSICEANKALVRRETSEILDGGNVDVIDELYAEDVVVRTVRAGAEDRVVSRADLKAVYADWKRAFPDLRAEVTVEAAEDDVVVHHLTLRGTHRGPFRGIEPTGVAVEVDGFHFRRIRDGRVVETASIVDTTDLLEQLGADLSLRA